ncbi:MAG TPA: phosphate acyltransferase PlsX [Candidatus Polarisedimenticolia bacterium]|nr:phosphate acyltransferase PlsX [Candidatus Polarisedimenticolia bacterium]
MGEATERPIAIDAMGGDHAPAHPVAGAILAARELHVPIVLVGRRPEIEAELKHHHASGLPISVRHADEVVGMEESPVNAFRRKKDSSIHVGATMLKDGEVQAFLSAGNTGAVMTTVKVLCGVLEGVERPALCAVVPNLHGPSVWLDVGANVDCRPDHLAQFAVMGHLYAREVLAITSPRVGLMSVGEEAGKGNDVTREAFRILKETPLNFIGNVEGRDIFSGKADVIVCDGFIGNVSLKAVESAAEALLHFMKDEIGKSAMAKIGYLLARPAFRAFRRKVDYAEYGGVPLLGVRGTAIVCHGGSSARAIKNAVRAALEFNRHNVNDRIRDEIVALIPRERPVDPASGAAAAPDRAAAAPGTGTA